MKATDLMQNDWYSGLNWSSQRDFYQHDIYEIEFFDDCEPEPIPLTEEILKANGFKLESDGYNWYHPTFSPEQVYVHVALRKNGNVRRVEVKKQRAHFYRDTLPYAFPVHELQQVLRLCGLSELADNFKI